MREVTLFCWLFPLYFFCIIARGTYCNRSVRKAHWWRHKCLDLQLPQWISRALIGSFFVVSQLMSGDSLKVWLTFTWLKTVGAVDEYVLCSVPQILMICAVWAQSCAKLFLTFLLLNFNCLTFAIVPVTQFLLPQTCNAQQTHQLNESFWHRNVVIDFNKLCFQIRAYRFLSKQGLKWIDALSTVKGIFQRQKKILMFTRPQGINGFLLKNNAVIIPLYILFNFTSKQ